MQILARIAAALLISTLPLCLTIESFAADNEPRAFLETPEDSWEANSANRPSILSCERIDPAFVSAVVPDAQTEGITRLQGVPVIPITRRDAFRLLGMGDPGNGDNFGQFLTQEITRLKGLSNSTISDQTRLGRLTALRDNPNILAREAFLVRAVGHDVVYTTFSIALCGDILWIGARSPYLPGSAAQRLPLVAFLEHAPTKLYFERYVVGVPAR